jgi:succinate-semialdehyde dehydrogenase / glutarate-semialdehyde dehydrogenase
MSNVQISLNPYNNKENLVIPTQSKEELLKVLENSKIADQYWSKITLRKRLDYIESFKNVLIEEREELSKIIAMEMGCPISQSIMEVDKCVSIIDYFVTNGEKYIEDEIIYEDEKVLKKIHYDPIGTLFHISPYNYPLYLALRPIIPSLVVGNRNILKTPSNTPMMGKKIEEMIVKAGFPEGVFQVVFIRGSESEIIIQDDRINIVSLIGSERSGSVVASLCGKYLKKSILELGGNDPMIIFEDANVDKAVEGVMSSRLRNAGQSCNASKRFLVHKSLEKEFTEKLIFKLKNLKKGNPIDQETTIGPVANHESVETILLQIKKSVELGATIVYGGENIEKLGCYIEPCVIKDVTKDMAVFYEEVFGPVLPVIVFDGIDEAIELANNSIYGLGSSIWTQDHNIITKCIQGLESGNVAVNSIVRGDPQLPFGGVKKSGYGREFAKAGLHELANIKSISIAK